MAGKANDSSVASPHEVGTSAVASKGATKQSAASTFVANIGIGVLGGFIAILRAVSFAGIVVPGSMMPIAILTYIMGTFLSQLVNSFGSGFRYSMTAGSSAALPFLAEIGVQVAGAAESSFRDANPDADDDTARRSAVATVFTLLSLMALISGVMFVVFGSAGWSKIIQFVPRPVVEGFFTTIGWSLAWHGLCQGTLPQYEPSELTFSRLGEAFQPLGLARMFCTLLYGLGLALVRRTKWGSQFWVFPVGTVLFLVVFYIIVGSLIAADATSMEELRANGWVYAAYEQTPAMQYWGSTFDFSLVQWDTMHQPLSQIPALLLVLMLDLGAGLVALDSAGKVSCSMGHEFIVAGASNLLVGATGGTVTHMAIAPSRLVAEISASPSRVPGFTAAALIFAALFVGPSMLQFLPRWFVAGSLFYLGMGFLFGALVDTWSVMSRAEYGVILIMMVASILLDSLNAVGLGAALCCLFLAYRMGTQAKDTLILYSVWIRPDQIHDTPNAAAATASHRAFHSGGVLNVQRPSLLTSADAAQDGVHLVAVPLPGAKAAAATPQPAVGSTSRWGRRTSLPGVLGEQGASNSSLPVPSPLRGASTRRTAPVNPTGAAANTTDGAAGLDEHLDGVRIGFVGISGYVFFGAAGRLDRHVRAKLAHAGRPLTGGATDEGGSIYDRRAAMDCMGGDAPRLDRSVAGGGLQSICSGEEAAEGEEGRQAAEGEEGRQAAEGEEGRQAAEGEEGRQTAEGEEGRQTADEATRPAEQPLAESDEVHLREVAGREPAQHGAPRLLEEAHGDEGLRSTPTISLLEGPGRSSTMLLAQGGAVPNPEERADGANNASGAATMAVVLDCRRCEGIDSTGLTMLQKLAKECERARVRLCAAGPFVEATRRELAAVGFRSAADLAGGDHDHAAWLNSSKPVSFNTIESAMLLLAPSIGLEPWQARRVAGRVGRLTLPEARSGSVLV